MKKSNVWDNCVWQSGFLVLVYLAINFWCLCQQRTLYLPAFGLEFLNSKNKSFEILEVGPIFRWDLALRYFRFHSVHCTAEGFCCLYTADIMKQDDGNKIGLISLCLLSVWTRLEPSCVREHSPEGLPKGFGPKLKKYQMLLILCWYGGGEYFHPRIPQRFKIKI